MRRLIFFRHAKSDWDAGHAVDRERKLNSRGVEAARLMGRFLARTAQVPDSVVTSSALRARQTLDLAVEAGGWQSAVRVTDALYEADPAAVLTETRAEPDSTHTLLLVGHEPTWSEMVCLLAQVGKLRFPTAAMARVDLHIERWREAAFGRGELIWLVPPKLFAGFPEKGGFDFAGE